MLFDKILIANRGEIACRIIATAKDMGIRTVAVYSDADASAKHVAMADQAVHIGPAPVAESYLNADAIVAAALETGAQAIHPGYGFLSEAPDFVEKVEAAGLVFIGPSAKAIRAMGLKDAAKAEMSRAGVPVVPGYHGESRDPEFLAAEANKIGYPVLIKARAGGGGKGMRLVHDPAQFTPELEAAQREGQASFGDPVCLIEKYIPQPRHIEVQVLGDTHGNVVHLFERDCSLQRRYQKVIEEAPAPDMPEDVREAMGKAAVEAARAIGYCGAGTVEFIVDGSDGLRADGFWFMEMNTRLQVEHPVTEAITGLDLVSLQLRIAAGDPLPFKQSDLSISGWAFEARIYAEDVPSGFLPSTGTLKHAIFPEGSAFAKGDIRIDSGVRQGDQISAFYDPMIAKVIVHGPTRHDALNRLSDALAAVQIGGPKTNTAFLSALTHHAGFRAGEVDTHLIGRDLNDLTTVSPANDAVVAAVSLMFLGLVQAETSGSDSLWDNFANWRGWTPASFVSRIRLGDELIERRVTARDDDAFDVSGNTTLTIAVTPLGGTQYSSRSGETEQVVDLVRVGSQVFAFYDAQTFVFDQIDPAADDGGDGIDANSITAPMPGLVTICTASKGQSVSQGDTLMVLEAMKMEHKLIAPRDGIIAGVTVDAGAQVESGAVLLTLEPPDA